MIRAWEEHDREALRPLVGDCLASTYDNGADLKPSAMNVAYLIEFGLARAAAGDPCLLWEKDVGIIAYTLWAEMANPLNLDFRGKVCYGFGTYVLPNWRRRGISDQLRDAAEARAKLAGFVKVVGTAYHETGLVSCLNRGYRVAGAYVEKTL